MVGGEVKERKKKKCFRFCLRKTIFKFVSSQVVGGGERAEKCKERELGTYKIRIYVDKR